MPYSSNDNLDIDYNPNNIFRERSKNKQRGRYLRAPRYTIDT